MSGGSVSFADRKIQARLSGEAPCPVSPRVTSSVGPLWVPLPAEVIMAAVRCYLRYGLSYRMSKSCSLNAANEHAWYRARTGTRRGRSRAGGSLRTTPAD